MKPSAKNKLRYVFSRRFYPLKEENENKNFNKYNINYFYSNYRF